MHEDFPVQHNGIFKDRFVAPNVGYCFGGFDRQQSDLAGALARAVCDEPNFKYMIPNEQARVRFLTQRVLEPCGSRSINAGFRPRVA